MLVPPKVADKYNLNNRWVDLLKDKVKETLIPYCERNQFAFVFRIKSLESTAEKIETGRFNQWDEIDDFFACTIIIPTLSFEEEVIKNLKRYFKVIDIKKRGSSQKSPEIFRFDSTRVINKLKSSGSKSKIHDILFEVQVKSAFEYAWSVATHSLTYKSGNPEWKRLRLTSQLKASVEQLDSLIIGFDDTSKYIPESPWSNVNFQNLICDYVKIKYENHYLPEELIPKDMSRFSQNIVDLLKATTWFELLDIKSKFKCVNHVLEVIEYELNLLKFIPRSISLFQLFFGILVKRNLVNPPLNRYTPLITPELISLFPRVTVFPKVFKY